MRIAFIAHPALPGAWYRGIGPMVALNERYGHEIRQVWRPPEELHPEVIAGCDVLHIHRRHDEETLQMVRQAKQRGMAVVYDNDDDMTAVPKNNAAYRDYGGLAGERARAQIRALIAMADLVTTPSAQIARRFREDYEAKHVQVIENFVPDAALRAKAPPSNGDELLIGWLAGNEHHLDVERVPIREQLGRLLDAHENVRVQTIGVGLGLRHPRYEHVRHVNFFDLPGAQVVFDIGIAPLADISFNHARSNIKVKEYAALGKPWLASPVGPYLALGEKHGGRLVPDDRWFDELERLALAPRDLGKLAKRATKWGRAQAISANVGMWAAALEAALVRARS